MDVRCDFFLFYYLQKMAEPEVVSTRSPEPLIVHVLRTRNMVNLRIMHKLSQVTF